jgi:hypothetical protein
LINLLKNVGFWFALGIASGIGLNLLARFLFRRWIRPIIDVPTHEKDVWQDVDTHAKILVSKQRDGSLYFAENQTHPNSVTSKRELIRAYRLKVKNRGKSAAENVAGTLEFKPQGERRICWYEGNRPTIILNARDHSFLDVYGVLVRHSGYVCMPTENGWDDLYAISLKGKIEIGLRITAKNAEAQRVRFEIDPNKNCQPSWLD